MHTNQGGGISFLPRGKKGLACRDTPPCVGFAVDSKCTNGNR